MTHGIGALKQKRPILYRISPLRLKLPKKQSPKMATDAKAAISQGGSFKQFFESIGVIVAVCVRINGLHRQPVGVIHPDHADFFVVQYSYG